MDLQGMIAALDAEIERLTQARELLAASGNIDSLNQFKTVGPKAAKKMGRWKLSAEGKARIAEAQRNRWAARRDTAK
jgi:hypothetical protein